MWFSTVDKLNDPYDCRARIPGGLGQSDIEEVRRNLRHAAPYNLRIEGAYEIAKLVGEAQELDTLMPLGLLATQLRHEPLLRHIRTLNLGSDEWVRDLVVMAKEITQEVLANVTVHCLCETNVHPLMWAHYADSHKGFCAGYVSPIGIRNPALIHQVRYLRAPPPITAWRLVEDPGEVWRDLALTKSDDWAYEREWRLTFGNMPDLLPDLLPCREVILGSRTSPSDEASLRAAAPKNCRFYRAAIDSSGKTFNLSIVPADAA